MNTDRLKRPPIMLGAAMLTALSCSLGTARALGQYAPLMNNHMPAAVAYLAGAATLLAAISFSYAAWLIPHFVRGAADLDIADRRDKHFVEMPIFVLMICSTVSLLLMVTWAFGHDQRNIAIGGALCTPPSLFVGLYIGRWCALFRDRGNNQLEDPFNTDPGDRTL